MVEGVLLKPLPYPHAETLVAVQHTAPGLNMDAVGMAPSNYFIYREQNHVFEDIGLYMGDSVALTGQGSPEQVRALMNRWNTADSGCTANAGDGVAAR